MCKVSIVMATYNRAHLISETLESIQNQTYTNFECLIIDDGGTDETAVVLQPFLKDARFTYLKRPAQYQKGLPGVRNFGLDIAKGDYVIFFDDDDIVHPQNLEICVIELDKNSKIQFCRYIREAFYGDFNYNFDLKKEYSSFNIDKSFLKKIITQELRFNSCAVMWRKSVFFENRFVEDLMYAEEWELYSRIISLGIEGISINKTLFFGRKHINSNTAEFYQNNPIRVSSYIKAIKLVYKNLIEKNILDFNLYQYFLNYSYSFHNKNLTKYIKEKPIKTYLNCWMFWYINIKVWLFQTRKKKLNAAKLKV